MCIIKSIESKRNGVNALFKSTFAKYLMVFIIILMVSFIILSSIITTTIRTYVAETKENMILKTTNTIANQIEMAMVEDIETYIASPLASVGMVPLMNQDSDTKVLITDKDGKILLTTIKVKEVDDLSMPTTFVDEDLGKIEISEFSVESKEEGEPYLYYQGKINSLGKQRYQICAKSIITKNELRGYVLSLVTTDEEDAMVLAARKTIINSSLWVMLAAVVAVYFITERIINPLRNMTKATKSFAKGDFSTRVTVCGNDEIAELGHAFNHMAESLDNFEKMRNSFLANVSHDLRTPMTTIAGFIEGITSGAIPPEKHEYYLGVISSEVHRLSRLVTDLLDISRLESGERKFTFVSFDIAEMARIILISFEQKISEKNLDVNFESESDSMMAIGDKDAIHQVLYNLMHNAIKFAKSDGKFEISLKRTNNKKIKISVYDEGQGIATDELKLIFDRFYKTDKSRGLDKNGVGLGLYICKTIIDAHDEHIGAESKDENSAEFWFTLKEGTLIPKDMVHR